MARTRASRYRTVSPQINIPFAERWDGRRWSLADVRQPRGAYDARLDGVSCPAPGACVAVGSWVNRGGVTVPLAERLAAGRWQIQTVPAAAPGPAAGAPPVAGTGNTLIAVSCPTRARCDAIGSTTGPTGTQASLAESYAAPGG